MDPIKEKVLIEVLNEMDQRINYSLLQTDWQEQAELKQEIIARMVVALEKMEIVPFSTFEARFKHFESEED
ncbi:Uncharacterised protein [Niallia circulans]|nr:Uncharacterised protein [Niallia circulans]